MSGYIQIPRLKVISSGDEIHTTGNSPVKIIAEDYEMYLAKNSKSKNPACDIINELLAHCFLKLWELKTPEIAILDFSTDLVRPEYSKANHNPLFYQKPVFGSKWKKNAFDSNKFIDLKSKFDNRDFNDPLDVFKIGLFDIWVENDDRKPTNHNLMFEEDDNQKFNIIPIDHCYIFSTMNYQSLSAANFCPIANENLLVTDLAKSLKKIKHQNRNWDAEDKEYFYLCISKCEKYFEEIIRYIPTEWNFSVEDAKSLKSLLFDNNRNKKVIADYLEKVS